ncbi:hypothetical protein L6164_031934 [Bauhinia variegata]|uniref:Uncharacterized protein n=1 Tax=Bauhinia variegata TaxID=167791 RepID=A0ACB9KMU4_BAUVA|nr:hypothetical protein L6164_031934 [Bauhinia variegata]
MAAEATMDQKALPDFDPPKKPKRNKFAFVCAILASMTSILLGYDIGVMSGAAIFIKRDLKVSDVKIEILMGIINLYSVIGSCLAVEPLTGLVAVTLLFSPVPYSSPELSLWVSPPTIHSSCAAASSPVLASVTPS